MGFFGAFKNKIRGWFSKNKNRDNDEEPIEAEEVALIEAGNKEQEESKPETADKDF